MISTGLRRLAPVFDTTDLTRALDHYARLRFAVEASEGGDYYGYARHDGVEIHLAVVQEINHGTTTSSAYLWVDEAAAPYAQWAAAGVAGRLTPLEPTAYGLAEDFHVDPDGNLIRFGSSLDQADPSRAPRTWP
jgi:hypothetical protein